MRYVAAIGALVLLALCTGTTAEAAPNCNDTEKAIVHYRTNTWEYQSTLRLAESPTAFAERNRSCAYKRWAATLWKNRSEKLFAKIQRFEWDHGAAICHVFGQYCGQAKAVARCESGQSMSKNATNGQYLGMFQMGESERRIYGHSHTAIGQAYAAYAYFVNSGRDWSPWSCKP